MRLRVTHQSGKYNVKRKTQADYFARLIRQQGCHIFTATESRRIAWRLRRRLGKKWAVVGNGEHIIAWRKDKAESMWKPRNLQLIDFRYSMFRRMIRRWPMLIQNLHLSNGKRLRIGTTHAPSGIQGPGVTWRKKTEPKRVEAAVFGFARMGDWMRDLIARKPQVVQVATMDANLDMREEGWRDYLDDTLGAESVWDHRVPDKGTHGPRRVIDTAHVHGAEVVHAWVPGIKRPRGMDHRPFTFVIEL